VTNSEVQQALAIMRGTWPQMHLREESEVVWTFHMEEHDFADVMKALRMLAERQPFPPTVADFTATMKEAKARKHTCPRCAHGVATEAALAEHMFNVHGVE